MFLLDFILFLTWSPWLHHPLDFSLFFFSSSFYSACSRGTGFVSSCDFSLWSSWSRVAHPLPLGLLDVHLFSLTRSTQTRKAIYYSSSEGKNLSLGVYLPPGRAFYGHSLPFSLFLTYRFLPSALNSIAFTDYSLTPFMPRVSSLPASTSTSTSNHGKFIACLMLTYIQSSCSLVL